MSERRRRRAKEEDSDAESQASGENQQSDSESESDSSVHDDEGPALPNYEEAVKLEPEVEVTTVVSDKKAEVKPRSAASTPKKDPAVVPRSDRFFLHDNREGGSGKSGSGRSPRKGESSRDSERQDKRRTPKKEEVNLWKHDKYEEIVLKDTSKGSKPVSSQQRRTNERSNKPSTESSVPPRITKVSATAGDIKDDSPNTPDPIQAYLKNTKKGPAPNYSTSRPDRPERPATQASSQAGRPSQDSRSGFASRGPPTHPIESTTPVTNRQTRETNSAGKHAHAASPATKITYSQTAPTAPGSVEKTQQQSRGPPAAYAPNNQRPSESNAQPSYRSALETQPVARPVHAATAPVFIPAAQHPHHNQHQQQQQAPVQQQVHVTLTGTPHLSAPQRIEQTVRMTPIKAPPGLDTSLNPSAREFQPTDDSPTPTPSNASSGRQQLRYDTQGPSGTGGYEYPPIVRPTGQNGPYHEAPHSAQPLVQQVSYRPVSSGVGPAPVGPSHGGVYANQGHPGHVGQHPSTAHGHHQIAQHSPAHGGEYRPRRDAPRNLVSPSHSDADLYAHSMHMPHAAAHPSMMYRGAQGGYNMPMNMYDQMMYMDPRIQYMPDGTVWYANVPVPGPADGAPVSGGTVYYPLPPTPGNE